MIRSFAVCLGTACITATIIVLLADASLAVLLADWADD